MKIFINAKTEELCANLSSASEELGAEISCAFDDRTAERDLSEFDAVIISTPLRSEFGLNYTAEAAKRTTGCIILLAKTDIAEDVRGRIGFTGAYVLERPFPKAALIQTLRIAMQAKDNILRLERENARLSGQIDDMKLIDRAKCLLIQYLNMTEEQAHSHIQKLAMDSRRRQREVAEDILHTYSAIN